MELPWPIGRRADTSEHGLQVWEAVACHRSQLLGYQALKNLPLEHHRNLRGKQTFYRAFSPVNGGRFPGLPINTQVTSNNWRVNCLILHEVGQFCFVCESVYTINRV